MTRQSPLDFDLEIFLAEIDGGKSILAVENKQAVFQQGGRADCVYYLRKGKVKLSAVSPSGKEAVIGIVTRGQFFGEDSLVTGHPLRMVTATSMGPSTVVEVKRKTMLRALRDNPDFAATFTSYLIGRTIRVAEDLIDQLFNSSEKRLARVLLLLANFGKESEPQLVVPKISQETLAQIVGTTRARVSTFMNKFRKLGFIEYNGGLRVRSSLFKIMLRE